MFEVNRNERYVIQCLLHLFFIVLHISSLLLIAKPSYYKPFLLSTQTEDVGEGLFFSGLKKPFAYYLKKNYDAILRDFNLNVNNISKVKTTLNYGDNK